MSEIHVAAFEGSDIENHLWRDHLSEENHPQHERTVS